MKKKIGAGSISMLLVVLALIWSCNFQDFCIGDLVLTYLGLPAWSEGSLRIHYTVFWALLLYIPAFFLGHRYESHLYARSGKWLSGCIGSCLMVMGIAMVIWR